MQDQHSRLFREPAQSSILGWDESFYYFWLRSALVEGDVDFAKDLTYCHSLPRPLRETALQVSRRTALGLVPNKYPIGWALLEVPWYAAADLTAQLVDAAGGTVRRDGWQPLYQMFLMVGQIAYGVAGLYFAYDVLTELLPPALAACGLALGWMCSPLCYYQTLDLAMAHNVMFFAVAGAYYFTFRLRANPARRRYWGLVGFFCACAILSRYQGAVMLLFPGVVCLRAVWKDPRLWKGLLVGLAAGAIPLSLQVWAWKCVYDRYFLYTYEGEGFDWRHPHFYEALFSSYHGLFNWHPFLLLGFVGFVAWAWAARRATEAIPWGASLGLMFCVNSAWSCWWFGDSFGSRAFESCTLFAMLGFGFLLQVLSQRRVAFRMAAMVLLLAGLWNMDLIWLVRRGLLPLDRPVSWRERVDLTWNEWLRGS